MNLHWLDWTIVGGFVVALTAVSLYAKRFSTSVADYLVANRCAGRYLLTIADGAAGLGAISVVAAFEMYFKAGFSAAWWQMMTMPIALFVALSGWVIYRYRETRAMTMGQMFEMRYSRAFRVFCGILGWVSGVINMGIFPAVTAQFFIYFCGLPESYSIAGVTLSSFVTIMIVELSIALSFTLFGGMVVIAVTDFTQGLFMNIMFLVILVVLAMEFKWSQVTEALSSAPADASLINPFQTSNAESFNIPYFLMNAFYTIYIIRAWQGTQGFSAAARNAHEAKMAGIIGRWREIVQNLALMMMPICVYAFLHHVDFASQADEVNAVLGSIQNPQIREQMTVPLGLSRILPIGVVGLFAVGMLAAAISTDDTYLHSWGNIFVQDIVLPFRQTALSPKQHLRLLRFSSIFVAICVFAFSLIFRQVDYIYMFFAITGAIYLGGAGSVIVGGLYWKRGSTNAAWGAMATGGGLAVTGIIVQQLWPTIQPLLVTWFPRVDLLADHPDRFPWDGMQINFIAICSAIAVYVCVSMWDSFVLGKQPHDMKKFLHRGEYAIQGEHDRDVVLPTTGLRALLPTKEFTARDKLVYFTLLAWTVGWYIFFVTITSIELCVGLSDEWWIGFWRFNIVLMMILGTGTTIWFLIGGCWDVMYLFRTLRLAVRDVHDDGRVEEKPE